MKTLILTEKPSVARDFAKALNVNGKRDGYLESDSYVLTWAVGHLVELFEPEAYDAKWAKWDLATLPIIPEEFRYRPIKQSQDQLKVIGGLLARPDIERLVIATDAGREGEVIARTVLNHAGLRPEIKTYRFWTSQALTPEVIQQGLAQLKPASSFERLWHAGQARQMADWLVGMNGSRAASIKLRDLFSVGRVQTAVLALIVDRFLERESFVPEPFWQLKVCFSGAKGRWWGTWYNAAGARFDTVEAANELVQRLAGAAATVTSLKKQKKKQAPPPLYSLTELQREANQRFGFTAKHTLDVAQQLYEARKCLSYPRTDSQVMGSQNVELVSGIIRRLNASYADYFEGVDPKLVNVSNKRVFNDAKLTDHHALIPLAQLPLNATTDESRLYFLVLKRFAAAFHPDCEYEQTDVITEAAGETFRTRGRVILKQGWQVVYKGEEVEKPETADDDDDQAELPPLKEGDAATVAKTDLVERHTSPPARYTEALLLKDMSSPAKYVSEADLKKVYRGDVGLGTQATRAQIIETLIDRKYVTRQKKYLDATSKGIHLIKTLRGFETAAILASPEETARWEQRLESIAQGQEGPSGFMSAIKGFVSGLVEEFKAGAVAVYAENALGSCPACGGLVSATEKAYGCTNWREENGGCRFVLWKTIAGRAIEAETVQQLLNEKRTAVLEGFTSKQGKSFAAALKLEQKDGRWQASFDFANDAPNQPGGPARPENGVAGHSGQGRPEPDQAAKAASKPASFGACPDCGAPVIQGRTGFGCSAYRQGCRFVIWQDFLGHAFSGAEIATLLKGETLADVSLPDGQTLSLKLEKLGETWEVVPE